MSVHLNLLGDKNPWWYPKSGGTWITDTISEEDLRVVGIIPNVSLVEIIIGTFNQFNIMTRARWTPIRGRRKTVSSKAVLKSVHVS